MTTRQNTPLSTTLQEILQSAWSRHLLDTASADEIDENGRNGWVTLPPLPLGTVYLRQGHVQYPDGLTLVDNAAGATGEVWSYFLKQDDAGRPQVEIQWQKDFEHDCEEVPPSNTQRRTEAHQRLEQLAAAFKAQDARWQATLAWTDKLREQASASTPDASSWLLWWAQCDAMQRIAEQRGWAVTRLLATPPATEAELTNLERAHRLRIPAQLRELLGQVASDIHFGWYCSRDDKPRGELSNLYSGGIRDTLWSLDAIDRYALANFSGWREYYQGVGAPERETGQSNNTVLWENQFAFAHLVNGDALTIDTTDPDPAAQPVRYFSHEADGMQGEVLAPNLYAFFDAWCTLGCAGNEAHDWWNLRDPHTGYLSAQGTVAKQWREWLQRDLHLRDPDEAPRSVLARSAADRAWLEAAKAQDQEALQAALTRGAQVDCSPNHWEDENYTAVIYTVKHDNLPLLRWLHARGASLSTTLLSTFVAVRHAQPATLQWLIEQGARVDRWRDQRYCPLHELISGDRTSEDYRALMDLLLQAGADPNACWDMESSGPRTTGLMRAGPWTAQRLLAAGADPHLRDLNGYTALHHADAPEVIDLLVKAGLDPNDLSTPDDEVPGCTPLQFALREEYAAEVVPTLLAAGADPHRTDTLGRNAWFYCFDAQCVDLLLSLGFEVNAQDREGRTVLHHLLAWTHRLYDRYLEAAERLVQRGMNLNAADCEGNTVLHRMASCYNSEHDRPSLEFLLGHEADPSLRNHKGQQPWQCVKRKYKDAIALLKPDH